jgi:hypothetical protein
MPGPGTRSLQQAARRPICSARQASDQGSKNAPAPTGPSGLDGMEAARRTTKQNGWKTRQPPGTGGISTLFAIKRRTISASVQGVYPCLFSVSLRARERQCDDPTLPTLSGCLAAKNGGYSVLWGLDGGTARRRSPCALAKRPEWLACKACRLTPRSGSAIAGKPQTEEGLALVVASLLKTAGLQTLAEPGHAARRLATGPAPAGIRVMQRADADMRVGFLDASFGQEPSNRVGLLQSLGGNQ